MPASPTRRPPRNSRGPPHHRPKSVPVALRAWKRATRSVAGPSVRKTGTPGGRGGWRVRAGWRVLLAQGPARGPVDLRGHVVDGAAATAVRVDRSAAAVAAHVRRAATARPVVDRPLRVGAVRGRGFGLTGAGPGFARAGPGFA